MAGKIYDGNDAALLEVRNSRSFCEGMQFRGQGTAAAFPATGNPYDGEGTEEETAWDEGWGVAHAAAGGSITSADMACCGVNPDISA